MSCPSTLSFRLSSNVAIGDDRKQRNPGKSGRGVPAFFDRDNRENDSLPTLPFGEARMNWKETVGSVTLLFGALFAVVPADAEIPRCRVSQFAGASLPSGAAATMRVISDGQSCGVTLYGVPTERRNAATDGVILQQPKHGKAEFVGARLQYTPEPGFVGDDEFSGQAWATGDSRTQLLLKIHMKVQVLKE